MRSCTATPHVPMLFTEWWYLRSEDGPAVVSTAATRHGPLEALPVSCNTRWTHKTDYMIKATVGHVLLSRQRDSFSKYDEKTFL